LPTKEEFTSLKQHFLAQRDTPLNPSSFSDKVDHVFYKQVIDTESYNVNSMKPFPYDPSGSYKNNTIGKPTSLIFCPKMIMKVQVSQTDASNSDPHYSKALPSNVDYERLSNYFAFRPNDVIQYILRQTTQLAKPTIYYHMKRHLKSLFQILRHKRLNEVIATDIYLQVTGK
jgi:hypothetical protein